MDKNSSIIIMIAIMAAATFITRLLPFLYADFLKSKSSIKKLGDWLPLMIMPILIIASINREDLHNINKLSIHLIGVATVLCLHHLFRKTLLSILAGTSFFILLQNTIAG